MGHPRRDVDERASGANKVAPIEIHPVLALDHVEGLVRVAMDVARRSDVRFVLASLDERERAVVV
jgi:hypothetical protein